MRTRAEKRHNDWKKAIRKRRIDRERDPNDTHDWYDNLHQYSKNKIHCSCPLCRAKTGKRKSLGTNSKNWSMADEKRIEEMKNQEEEIIE